METTHYDYLNFIRFTDLREWDIKRYFSIPIKSDYQIIALSDILIEQKEKFKINDSNKDYGILGVNNQTGIFDAYTENGAKIKQKYKRMECGWIAYNPYRVNVGSIGIKKESNLYEYISPAYVVFSCKSSITPDYLFLTMKTNRFHNQICNATTGSVRQNLSFEILKTLQIPLPTLEQQNNLVELYNTKIHQAESLEKEAAEINSDIENYLIEILGIKQQISNTNNAHNGFLQIIKFSNLDKWGVDKLLYENHEILCSAKFTNIKLKDILEINPSTSFEELKDETILSFIPMECISEEYGEFITQKNGSKKESNGYTKFKNGDLIWAKITPCMQNGKSAIATNLKNGFGYGSTEFYVLRNHNSQINTLYIHSLLRLPILLHSAMSSFVGSAGQQRVPKNFLENLYVPLPAIEIQNEIVSHINTQKKRIKELRTKATNLRKEAIAEFEKTIFE